LLPVVYGDVALDRQLGGTIVSTEEQFAFLARELHPAKILLAGVEAGIWRDFPTCTDLIDVLSYREYTKVKTAIAGSASVDVTGGMASKVSIMFGIIQENPALTARIFSGSAPGALLQALRGETIGTILAI
jgi:isopentenyl phosphate kinase